MTITKGERDELRRIVRGDFKALTEEIDVRRAEMMAEIEKRVATRFQASEEFIASTEIEINNVVESANSEILEKLRMLQDRCDGYTIQADKLHKPRVYFVREKRDEMRRAMVADPRRPRRASQGADAPPGDRPPQGAVRRRSRVRRCARVPRPDPQGRGARLRRTPRRARSAVRRRRGDHVMRRVTCNRCGQQTPMLTIPTCTPCLSKLVRLMTGKSE